MSNSEDLEPRVTSLEHQVARLREQAALAVSDAGSARVLAGGADLDVSDVRTELRAHNQVLNAL
ncbi:MAG: permease, partial [Pseudonocardiaceae bacterium]